MGSNLSNESANFIISNIGFILAGLGLLGIFRGTTSNSLSGKDSDSMIKFGFIVLITGGLILFGVLPLH